MAERAEQKSPYRQFVVGQQLPFTLHTLEPNGTICSLDRQITIAAIKGGGFFGRVLIPKDEEFVIKTSVPDPWHDLWRRINWEFREFPSQVSENQAKLDHLSTNLIADVIPTVTNGRFYAPHSLGYTELANGYAQVIEKMQGRPPRYDIFTDEYCEFRQAQGELKTLGYNLGLEHAAQIHEDNPFGMANLWKDGNNALIWLDTLPAIPHKGWIWPSFYFRFHQDVKHWFYPNSKQTTFDRIHPDLFLEGIQKHKHLFGEQTYQDICDNLNLYRQLWEEKEVADETPRNFRDTLVAGFESTKAVPRTISKLGEGIKKNVRVVFDANLRRIIVNNYVLAGTRKAFNEGLISLKEFEESKRMVEEPRSKKILPVLTAVYGYNQTTNWLFLKPSEAASYVYLFGTDVADKIIKFDLTPILTAEDIAEKLLLLGFTFAGFRVVGMANSYLGTKLIGKISGMDLETAARVSAVPVVGSHLAIPAQFVVTLDSKSEAIWHYNVRAVVAAISSIHPAGGWGTQYEGLLWKKIGKFLESWANVKKT